MCIQRVPDQNGVSQECYILEIYHSGLEPSIYCPVCALPYVWTVRCVDCPMCGLYYVWTVLCVDCPV